MSTALKVHLRHSGQPGMVVLFWRIAGSENSADLVMAHLTLAEITKHSARLECSAVLRWSNEVAAASVGVGRPEFDSATRPGASVRNSC